MTSSLRLGFLNSPVELATTEILDKGLDALVDRIFAEWLEAHHVAAPETDPEFAELKGLIAAAISNYDAFKNRLGEEIAAEDIHNVLRSPVATQNLIKRLQLMRP